MKGQKDITNEALLPKGFQDDTTRHVGEKASVSIVKKDEQGLDRYDALHAYLQQIRSFSILSRQEERRLAVRYKEHGDIEAAYKLITSNLRLVVAIALKFYGVINSVLDLIQEGNLGLMQAVKQFDPYKGARLSSYAVWWIRAYILRYIINNAKTVKIGTTEAQRKLFFRLEKEREKLLKEGYNPGAKLLAERLDVKEEEVNEMAQRLSGPDLSLDYSYDGSRYTLNEKIGVVDDIMRRVVDDELKTRRLEKIGTLKDKFKDRLNFKEKVIYERRIFSDQPATLQELGEELGVTRERVRQLEAGIFKKFKTELGKDRELFESQ